MTVFSLTVLKFVFLGLLYVFVWRALRWVVGDLRAPRASKRGAASPVAAQPARRRTKVPAQLVVIDDRGKRGAAVPMTGTIQIGRAEACHVRIEDRYASQFHARLYPRNGSWYVEDLGSTNGTYLNRQRVTGSVELQAGDEVRVGKTTLEIRR